MKAKNILRTMAVVVLVGMMIVVSQNLNSNLGKELPLPVEPKPPSENQGTEAKPMIEKITEIPS